MGKKTVKIKFANNLNPVEMLNEVLWLVSDVFEFVESEQPDFLVFGPYGPPPPPGDYVRVGYYCEYMWPNLGVCDWAFGIPYDEDVGNDRYCRIEWHGIRPQQLVKDVARIQSQPIPPRFCNFTFSNPVGFRESFFRALSCYKHVDAAGKSMNNRSSLDADYPDDDRWVRKRKFLSQYKFTIAFENNSALGYNTEKLTDPMLAGSLPIYLGNPQIGRHFNPRSFINAHDYLPCRRHFLTRWVEQLAREKYGRVDRLPLKFQPRFRKAMRILKHRLEYGFNFSRLIARIKEVGQDESLYRAIRAEPFVPDNRLPSMEHVRNHWIKVFNSNPKSYATAG